MVIYQIGTNWEIHQQQYRTQYYTYIWTLDYCTILYDSNHGIYF